MSGPKKMTAKQAIQLAHDTSPGADHRNKVVNEFILKATVRQLQKFIHGIYARDDNVYFVWAKIALDIRIGRSLFRLTTWLTALTVILVGLTITLVFLTYKLAKPGQAAPPSPPATALGVASSTDTPTAISFSSATPAPSPTPTLTASPVPKAIPIATPVVTPSPSPQPARARHRHPRRHR
jgi:hypothetical protein